MKFVVTLVASLALAMLVSSCASTLEKYFELDTDETVESIAETQGGMND